MQAPEGLLRVLDELVEVLGERALCLRLVTECVRQADPEPLAQALSAEADVAERLAALDGRLQEHRIALAVALGLDPAHAGLGQLVETLDGPGAIALGDRRERLAVAIGQLRDEASGAARVVRYALDFNIRLMSAITGGDRHATTYTAAGSVQVGTTGPAVHHRA